MSKGVSIKLITWVVVLLSLLACSSENNSDDSKPLGVIPQHQLDTLDRAKNTEALILDADKKRREQLEK
ncbi:MAG: hypothetical protein V7459_12515 [Oceanicoccus sp.]